MKKTIQSIFLFIFLISYTLLGLIQVAAIMGGIENWLNWPKWIAFFLALPVGFTPIIGPILGVMGAIHSFGWSPLFSLLLFSCHIWIGIIFGVVKLFFDKFFSYFNKEHSTISFILVSIIIAWQGDNIQRNIFGHNQKISRSISSLDLPVQFENSICRVKSNKGSGTGTIISKDGMLLTNAHVISEGLNPLNPKEIIIECKENTYRVKRVLFCDHEFDIALLRLNKSVKHFIPLSESKISLVLGDKISIIGYPVADEETGSLHKRALTNGNIIGIAQHTSMISRRTAKYIITDATSGKGGSGSPMIFKKNVTGVLRGVSSRFDMYGRTYVVGVSLISNAIDYTRKIKNKNFPSNKECLRKKSKGCSEKALYLWSTGKIEQAKKIYKSQCGGRDKNCIAQNEISTIIQSHKHADKKDSNNEQKEVKKIKSLYEISMDIIEEIKNLFWYEKALLALLVLIIIYWTFRLFSYFFNRFSIEGERICTWKKMKRDIEKGYREDGVNLDNGILSRNINECIFKDLSEQIKNHQKYLESKHDNKENSLTDKLKEIENDHPNDKNKFEHYYMTKNNLAYNMLCFLCCVIEFGVIFFFINHNFKEEYSPMHSMIAASVIALSVPVVLLIIKKMHCFFIDGLWGIYLLISIPSFSYFIYRVVEARTSPENEEIEKIALQNDFWFGMSTALMFCLSYLALDYYLGNPRVRLKLGFSNLEKEKNEIASTENKIDKIVVFLESFGQKHPIIDIVKKGTQSFRSRLRNSKDERDGYIQQLNDIEGRRNT